MPQGFDEAAYVEALKNDLLHDADYLETSINRHTSEPRKIRSIFFGGGTPSLFSPSGIEDILNFAEKTIGFENNIEITLEANPGTFEQEKFSHYFQIGINRLSIGIQSFEQKHLEKLGRIHNSDEAKRAINIAKEAGFKRINIDLMHGLPEQSVDNAINDLQTAIAFSPQHISWYQLTIEPNTVFYRQPPPLPADDVLADIQYHGHQLLVANGFEQYEISAFSRTDEQSIHNQNYWEFGDYIGIGAGAHGKLTNIEKQQIIRTQKTRLPEHYIQKSKKPNARYTVVEADELPIEFMMNALRLNQGVPIDFFSQRTGLPLQIVAPAIKRLQQQGLLDTNPQRIVTTDLGRRFLNTVLEKLTELDEWK